MDGECCLENSGTALSPKAVPKEASEVRSSPSNAAILWSTRLRRSRSVSLCFASESSVSFCKSSLLCSYSGLARETPLLLRVGVTAAANSNFVRRARNVRSDFCVSLFSRATLSPRPGVRFSPRTTPPRLPSRPGPRPMNVGCRTRSRFRGSAVPRRNRPLRRRRFFPDSRWAVLGSQSGAPVGYHRPRGGLLGRTTWSCSCRVHTTNTVHTPPVGYDRRRGRE
jgi:hypothetical protein